MWEGLQGDLLDDACIRAEEVVHAVRSGIFWPPADKAAYNDFKTLFHEDPADVMDPVHLRSFADEGSGTA